MDYVDVFHIVNLIGVGEQILVYRLNYYFYVAATVYLLSHIREQLPI